MSCLAVALGSEKAPTTSGKIFSVEADSVGPWLVQGNLGSCFRD